MKFELLNGDCLEVLKTLESNSVDSLVTDPPAGISFMGKEWDSDKGGRDGWIKWMSEVMRECLRVMKPGAHGLVWAIPRTSHWTATALEDAGFEIRDVITHIFGQGFPKSLDISKAIDKAAGAERTVISANPYAYKGSLNTNGKVCYGVGTRNDITAPATDAAKQWSGWGTALKPASEHWIMIRKPIEEKNVASNVIKFGTGGINIDASRIDGVPPSVPNPKFCSPTGKTYGMKTGEGRNGEMSQASGRFPANLVLSHSEHCTDDQCDIECAIKALDWQSDLNASRFFYCAKISKSERGAGNNHPTVKPKKLISYFCKLITPPGGVVLDPFMGSGSTGIAASGDGFGFIGIEREPDYFEIAQKRING